MCEFEHLKRNATIGRYKCYERCMNNIISVGSRVKYLIRDNTLRINMIGAGSTVEYLIRDVTTVDTLRISQLILRAKDYITPS